MLTYPFFLWFLPLVGLVILIHLINMFRHRRVEWAALEFLLASYRKSRTRILFQQLLLMLLRALAVAAVILMIAQPKAGGFLDAWFFGGPTHHIVLLDDSFSMNDRNSTKGGQPLFDETLGVVRRIIENADKHDSADRLTLIQLSKSREILDGVEPEFVNLPLNADGRQTVLHHLDAIGPSQHADDPEKMLAAALPLVRRTAARSKAVVYFLSDFRQRNWSTPDSLLKQIDEIKKAGASIRLVRAADEEHPNLAVSRLEAVDGIQASDIELLLDVTVVNFGRDDAENIHLMVRVDDRTLPSLSIPKITAGEETTPPIRFPVRLDGAGFHRIEVQLQADAIPDDNIRFLALNVPASLEILIITPSHQVSATDLSLPYIRTALSPGGTRSGITTQIRQPDYLTTHPLDAFGAIFLLDVPGLEPLQVSALENYVAMGGGLAIFPGPKSDLHRLREELYQNGNGLLPFAPTQTVELETDYLSQTPDIASIEKHPIFRFFEGSTDPSLSRVKIERYIAVEPSSHKMSPGMATSTNSTMTSSSSSLETAPNENVRILARLRDSSPLIVEKQFGRGRTLTFLTSVAPTWNNWARGNPGFVVLMLETAAWLSKHPTETNSLSVGQPIAFELDPTNYESSVSIQLPQADDSTASTATKVETRNIDDHAMISWPTTDRAGFYEATLRNHSGGGERKLFAVNVLAAEGDNRLADVSQLSRNLHNVNLSLESATGFSAPFEITGNRPWSDVLLLFLILLLVGEIFLAGRVLPPNTQRSH